MQQAKTQLSRLLERAHSGEEIIIAKNGTPYARLVPLESPRRTLGFLEGRLTVPDEFMAPLGEEELKLWEGP